MVGKRSGHGQPDTIRDGSWAGSEHSCRLYGRHGNLSELYCFGCVFLNSGVKNNEKGVQPQESITKADGKEKL